MAAVISTLIVSIAPYPIQHGGHDASKLHSCCSGFAKLLPVWWRATFSIQVARFESARLGPMLVTLTFKQNLLNLRIVIGAQVLVRSPGVTTP